MVAKYTPDPSRSTNAGIQGHGDIRLQKFSRANGVDDDPSREDSLDEIGDADGQTASKSGEVPKVRNLYFKDGKRRIDFVLAWSTEVNKKSEAAKLARKVFEENLEKEGLQLEYDLKPGKVHFVKIHAPSDVLKRYADILKMRMPMKEGGIRQGIVSLMRACHFSLHSATRNVYSLR